MAASNGTSSGAGGRNIPRMWDIFGKNTAPVCKSSSLDEVVIIADDLENILKLTGVEDSSSLSTNNDSAISVGSTSDEDAYKNNNNNNNIHNRISNNSSKKKKHARTSRKDEADGSNLIGTADSEVKYLERHLSMKKTIRKKIMRDLQKAFVEDPNEFRVEDIPREQLKAEINLQSLSFEPSGKKKAGSGKKNNESNFLDFLRTGSDNNRPSSNVNVSCGQTVAIGAAQNAGANHHYRNQYRNNNNNNNNSNNYLSSNSSKFEDDGFEDDDSGHSSPIRGCGNGTALVEVTSALGTADQPDEERNKTSFWRRFTIKGSRNKR